MLVSPYTVGITLQGSSGAGLCTRQTRALDLHHVPSEAPTAGFSALQSNITDLPGTIHNVRSGYSQAFAEEFANHKTYNGLQAKKKKNKTN